MSVHKDYDRLFDAPAYSVAGAARYLRLSPSTLRQWIVGESAVVRLANHNPPELSFANLLECHVINAMRERLSMESVRNGIKTAERMYETEHPLLDSRARTDGVSLLFQSENTEDNAIVNFSRGGQMVMSPIVSMFLERINFEDVKLFPFVRIHSTNEPKIVSIGPRIASGRSVIDGTGISTAIIASRFAAREKPSALAREYGLDEEQVYEAIRWERPYTAAA